MDKHSRRIRNTGNRWRRRRSVIATQIADAIMLSVPGIVMKKVLDNIASPAHKDGE